MGKNIYNCWGGSLGDGCFRGSNPRPLRCKERQLGSQPAAVVCNLSLRAPQTYGPCQLPETELANMSQINQTPLRSRAWEPYSKFICAFIYGNMSHGIDGVVT